MPDPSAAAEVCTVPTKTHAIQAAIVWALTRTNHTPSSLVAFLCPPPTYQPEDVRRVLVELLYERRLLMDDDRTLRWADRDAEEFGATDYAEAVRERLECGEDWRDF